MTAVAVAIEIDRPVAEVWADLSQLENHVDWMSDAERIDFRDDRRRGVGTEMRVRTRVGPLVTTDVIVVDEWVEEATIGVTHRGLVTGQGRFLLEPIAPGTRFTWHEDIRFPWYLGGGLTAWFAQPVLTHIWRKNLSRFAARFG